MDLKLTHLAWSPEATLIHFQGKYLTVCELDYHVLEEEIQNEPKSQAAVTIGQYCLVEESSSGLWFRGRVNNIQEDLLDVFLIDHGHVLSVAVDSVSSCANDLFNLPPKIVCGFLANLVLLPDASPSVLDGYFSSLIGKNITGYIRALLPDKVLLLEVPDINSDLVKHGFGRHMDSDTFLFLVEMLTEIPLKRNVASAPDLLADKPRGPEFCFQPSALHFYKEILSCVKPRLSCGTRVKMRVTAAVSPGLFYCQMARAEAELLEMSKKLAAECDGKAKQADSDPLGSLCAVKAKDGRWYRGYLQFLPVNTQVSVLLIDYGSYDSVKVENLHRLPLGCQSAPVEAFPCSLQGQDEAAKTQQLSFLKVGLLGGVMDVEITGFDAEQHLYSITAYGAEYDHMEEAEPIQAQAGPVLVSRQGGNGYETVVGEAFHKTLEAEEIQVDSTFVGYVVLASNPNRFWIRTEKRNGEFEEMMATLANHFSQVPLDEDILVNPELGTLCCAIYEKDLHFYRAVVTDVLDHGVEVLFIDFGNTEKVPPMFVKRIPEVIAHQSAFALSCTLANVFPMDECWSSATEELFRGAVSNKALLVHVVHKRKNKIAVDLHRMEGDNNSLSISELIISSDQPEYLFSPIKSAARRDRHTSGTNTASLISTDTETAAQTVGFKALRLEPGSEAAVHCSCINSPAEFWCQPLDKQSTLERLMKNLQQYYSTHTVPHQPGEACCVIKSPVDSAWYRALITARQSGRAAVLLVDYGCTTEVEEHGLQAVTPEYMDLEAQALRCRLNGLIEPAEPGTCGEWSSTVNKSLKDFVLKSIFGLKCQVFQQLNVKNTGLCYVVDLYDTQTQQSLTSALVESGLAKEATRQLSTPDGVPESFLYRSYGVSPGTEEVVYVTHVCSPWEVYCHFERNSGIIQELEEKISEEREKAEQDGGRAVVSRLCLAKYFDGQWYRGLARPVVSPLHLSVSFVDYGNSEICEKTQVMFLPTDSADLLFTPMQAMRCRLAAVPKTALYADANEWLFKDIVNKEVRAVVVGKSEDGSFEVELFDGDVHVNKKVNELIFSHSPKPVMIFNTSSTNITQEMSSVRNRRENRQTVNRRACKPIARAQQQRPDGTTRRVYKPPLTTWEVKWQTRIRDSSQSPARRQGTVCRLSALPVRKLCTGLKAKCFTSHIESMSSFFLQLEEDEPALTKMAEDLNADLFKDGLKQSSSLGVYDLVLAEFQEDGALYRSVVRNFQGTSCLIVEFIDYGNTTTVDKNKVYPLPKDHCSQPRLSISCSLLDTGTYENAAAFSDAVAEKPLMVEFVELRGSQWKVEIEVLHAEMEEQLPASPTESQEKMTSSDKAGKEQGVEPDEQEATQQSTTLEPPPAAPKAKLKGRTRSREQSRTRHAGLTKVAPHTPYLENGTVLSVQNDGRFYIRPARVDHLLAAVQRCIADDLHKCEMAAEDSVEPGLRCLAEVDDEWHRAVVRRTGSGSCQVLLVDRGVTVEAAGDALRQQCGSMTEIPSLAMPCKVTCGEGEDAQRLWKQTLTTMVGKEVKVVVVHYCEAETLWTVEVVMNELLLVGQSAASTHETQVTPTSTAGERELSGGAARPQRLAFAPIEVGRSYFGFATEVMTPFKFCVVLDHFPVAMKQLSFMLDAAPGPMCPLPEAHLIPGTCCLVKSDFMDKWCRAEVESTDDDLLLNLVDHGSYELVWYEDRSKLKRLPQQLVDLPKMLYHCTLRGVTPIEGVWTEEAAAFFDQRLDQKSLQIFIRESMSNTRWKVDIVADGVHVAKDLVDAGHASYSDGLLELRYVYILDTSISVNTQ